MKKKFIAAGVIILLAVSVFAIARIIDNNNDDITKEEVSVSTTAQPFDYETKIHVDGWLKISEICEYEGRLALVAENISDVDVEYALLTAKNKSDTFTFSISALLRGTKVMLICNEAIAFNPDEIYTGWKIENLINFENTPAINDDAYEVSVVNGSISVRNVSDEDITSDILIYYKEKHEDILNGSVTHRVRVSGIKANSQKYININGLNETNCQILFTEYDDKKV